MNTNEAVLKMVKTLAHENGSDRVLICDVVACLEALEGISMADVHTALLALQDADKVVLYRNDATRSVSRQQQATALMVGGHPRHLVYVL